MNTIVMSSNICPYSISEKTLVLGAGGGYDIYTCLSWYLGLTDAQKDLCIMANYSFTDDLYKYEDKWIVKIVPSTLTTKKNNDYFPERDLAISLNKPIYAVRLIPNPLLETALDEFVEKYDIKQIILVDGGVDACLYGDEKSFGSPLEDSQTVTACFRIAKKRNMLCKLMCSALHIDAVSANTFLKHWKDFEQQGFDCHKIYLSKEIIPFAEYKKIVQAPDHASIINESIIAAIEGHRGKYKNPRLFPVRVDDPEHLPILYDDTCYLFWLDVKQYMSFSIFYQKILECEPSVNNYKNNDEYVYELWKFWDEKVGQILRPEKYL